jgi:signal transduction histidine kinase
VLLPLNDSVWCAGGGEHEFFCYRGSTLVRRVPLPAEASFFLAKDGVLFAFDSTGEAFSLRAGASAFEPARMLGWPTRTTGKAPRLCWHSGDDAAVILMDEHFYLVRSLPGHHGLALEKLDAPAAHDEYITDVVWSEAHNFLAVATDVNGFYIHRRCPIHTRGASLPRSVGGSAFYAQIPLGSDSVLALSRSGFGAIVTGDTCIAIAQGLERTNFTTGYKRADGSVILANSEFVTSYDPRSHQRKKITSADAGISCFRPDGDTTWVGTYASIGMLVDDRFTRLAMIPGSSRGDGVYSIRRAADHLWSTTCASLLHLDLRTGRLHSIPKLEQRCPRALEVIDGVLMVGTYGNGAFVVSGDSAWVLPLDGHRALAHTHAFMRDTSGYLWMSTNQGLIRCSWKDVLHWISARKGQIPYSYFGVRAGISNLEFNGGCEPSSVMLPNGTASFPSMNGLVQFEPQQMNVAEQSGNVIIETISVDGEPWDLAANSALPASTKELKVTFSLSFWEDPLDLRLEYRLHPQDPWRALDPEQRNMVVPAPQPGSYAVELRMNGAQPGTSGHRIVNFSVEPSFWSSKWGIALIGLLSLLVFFFFQRLAATRLKSRNSALEVAVSERTARLEHANEELERSVLVKEKLISIVTHDIVSPLRFIAQVARRTAENKTANQREQQATLGDIQFAAEKLHSNAQNLLSWIKHREGDITPQPRHVVLTLLVSEMFDRINIEARTKGIALVNDVPFDDVVNVDKDLLSIVLNNLLINAVTYTERGEIRISSEVSENEHRLIITDTGPGFSAEARERISRALLLDRGTTEGTQGFGYVIIDGIMELLGGKYELGMREGGGSKVVLLLPQ